MTDTLTIGERVAWYRQRRGLPQEVLAGLTGRTTDWLSKVENNKIALDRLSIIKTLADALDVSLGDLLAEPSLMESNQEPGQRSVTALREALMNYRQLTPLLGQANQGEPPTLSDLEHHVGDLWAAYQASQFGLVTRQLPLLLREAQLAVQAYDGDARLRALSLFALIYQAAATTLTKIGEADLAWIASDRGLTAAQDCGNPVIIGSLFRSVTHSLLSNGRFSAAVQLTRDAAGYLETDLNRADLDYLSVYGTLFLAGSMAAARSEDPPTTREFLAEADGAARRLGRDANHMWTAFGPTNVAVHRVATAMELGDVQVAVDLGPKVDATALPTERRVRHTLEVARALSAWNRRDGALRLVLEAEQLAPEQVRYHFLSRHLVLTWIRQQKGRPSRPLRDLARRLKVA